MIGFGHNWYESYKNDYLWYNFVNLSIFEKKVWNVSIYDIFARSNYYSLVAEDCTYGREF